MITVLLNWGYIFIITYLIGLGFFKLLSILLKRPFTITFFFLDIMWYCSHYCLRPDAKPFLQNRFFCELISRYTLYCYSNYLSLFFL